MVVGIVLGVVVLFILFSFWRSVRIVREFERIVILRLGRAVDGQGGPGVPQERPEEGQAEDVVEVEVGQEGGRLEGPPLGRQPPAHRAEGALGHGALGRGHRGQVHAEAVVACGVDERRADADAALVGDDLQLGRDLDAVRPNPRLGGRVDVVRPAVGGGDDGRRAHRSGLGHRHGDLVGGVDGVVRLGR